MANVVQKLPNRRQLVSNHSPRCLLAVRILVSTANEEIGANEDSKAVAGVEERTGFDMEMFTGSAKCEDVHWYVLAFVPTVDYAVLTRLEVLLVSVAEERVEALIDVDSVGSVRQKS